jgi:YidC/Oxa1 family membrane protein insertase
MVELWTLLILNPFTNVLLWIYNTLGHGPEMFGVAIILFTILIRVITWPLNASQLKSAKVMQDLQNDKEWLDIQKKYAKDPEKKNSEMFRIYQERGINPFASCLPTLIQFPVLIGLYQSIIRALASTPLGLLQLTQALYMSNSAIIPLNSKFLWMDLGTPEHVIVLGFALPTLAVAVALITYVQTKLTIPPTTNPNDSSAQMSQSMTLTMPLMLGYFALNYASGLAVYLITTSLLGVVQYAMLGRVNWRNLLPGGAGPDPAAGRKKK